MNLYLITNKVNGKRYVGITSSTVEARMSRHRYSALKLNCPYPIHAAIRKYGWENFMVELGGTAETYEELLRWEKFIIKELGTQAPNGYNITEGGRGCYGRRLSDETKQKMSIKAKQRPPVSEETRRKLSEAGRRREYKPLGPTGRPAWNRGLKHSDESRAKMSAARSGKGWHSRRCLVDDVEYSSITDAVKGTGLSMMQVRYRLEKGADAYYLEPSKWPTWSSNYPKEYHQ